MEDALAPEARAPVHARARLYLWSGHALYLGPGHASSMHRHAALQVMQGVTHPLLIRSTPTQVYARVEGCIIPPHVLHQIDSAACSSLFLWSAIDAHGVWPRSTRSMATPVPLSPLQVQGIRRSIASMQQPWSCCDAAILRDALMGLLAPPQREQVPLDERIRTVLTRVQAEDIVAPRPVQQLARLTHLSVSRFRHLFRQQLGISVQQYVVWHRVVQAIQHTVAGMTLTEAAHAVGFADGAHLSRAFRATFGLPPSLLFKGSHSVQAISCGAC